MKNLRDIDKHQILARDKSHAHMLNEVFISALFLLLVNDFYLKPESPSFLTGKLSDISGLIVFVSFFTFLLGNRLKKPVFVISALIFCWWKSSLSSGFILGWNSILPFYSIARTVDYSDLFCLLVLVPLYFYKPKDKLSVHKPWIAFPVLLVTVFAISATSKTTNIKPYSPENTTLYIIDESFKIKGVTLAELLHDLELSNIKVEKKEDAARPEKPSDYHYYILKNYEFADDLRVESMHIAVREKNGNLKVLIQDVTLFNPPEMTEKEVRARVKEVLEEYFAIGE